MRLLRYAGRLVSKFPFFTRNLHRACSQMAHEKYGFEISISVKISERDAHSDRLKNVVKHFFQYSDAIQRRKTHCKRIWKLFDLLDCSPASKATQMMNQMKFLKSQRSQNEADALIHSDKKVSLERTNCVIFFSIFLQVDLLWI